MKKIELISRDELEARLQACLEQRQMPDYFLYLGDSGVKSWLTLSSSHEFPIAARLTELLRQSLPSIVRHLTARLDIVSIGVGNGEKERILLEALGPWCTPTYYAVDVSSEMVDAALNTVADMDVTKTGLVALFDDLELLRQFWRPPVLLCLLGNNFCNYEPDDALEIVYQQLESDDLFLFDCHLLPNRRESKMLGIEQVEQAYRSKSNIHFNIDPLVRRGLNLNNCVFHLDLLPTETSVGTVYRTSKWLHFLKDSVISCGPNKVTLSAGDTVRLGFTYKYTCSQVRRYLRRHGFHIVELFLSRDSENMLMFVRKKLSKRARDYE